MLTIVKGPLVHIRAADICVLRGLLVLVASRNRQALVLTTKPSHCNIKNSCGGREPSVSFLSSS